MKKSIYIQHYHFRFTRVKRALVNRNKSFGLLFSKLTKKEKEHFIQYWMK